MAENRFKQIFALIWILIECHLFSGNIFGFASLFNVLFRHGIYHSRCEILSEKIISNETISVTKDCRNQFDEYQLAFALGMGIYNLPALVLGMTQDFFGAKTLKIIGVVCHVIGWSSLGFLQPGSDWFILSHTIFSSIAGMCTLLSSFSIVACFPQRRGFITALIIGAQISSSIWYSVFQVCIEREWISLSSLAFLWTSLALMMLTSAFLFLPCRFVNIEKTKHVHWIPHEDELILPIDSLANHLTSSLFFWLVVFLSVLFLPVVFLSITCFSWFLHLTANNIQSSNFYILTMNSSTILSLIIAPLCGYFIDYETHRDLAQKTFNFAILQTLTWILSLVLCLISMFPSLIAALASLILFVVFRTILLIGCQSIILMIFPRQYFGSLLGILWTMAGLMSFISGGLIRLAANPINAWRAWLVIFILCFVMFGHWIDLWNLTLKLRKCHKRSISLNDDDDDDDDDEEDEAEQEEEMRTLK